MLLLVAFGGLGTSEAAVGAKGRLIGCAASGIFRAGKEDGRSSSAWDLL